MNAKRKPTAALAPPTELGSISISPIFDGTVTLRADDLLRPVGEPSAAWARHPEFELGEAHLELPLGGFLIRTSGRTILIDVGVGPIDNGMFRGGSLIESLEAADVACGDVTDVLLTHLHFDHIGWISRRGVPTFPRAQVHCHAADWDWFVQGDQSDPYVARKMTPITERLDLFDQDCTVAPGVSVRHAPGHTPGSTIVVLSSGPERALLLGDVAHCPVELTESDWEGVFDVDPSGARATRDRIARELESGTATAVGAHFDGFRFGRLMTVGNRRTWQL